MGIKFSNKASTSLTSGISTSDTTINVADASVFPTLGAGDHFFATLQFLNDSSETEVIKVTAINNNALTVDRSIESSKSFVTNDILELRVTAQALSDPTLLSSVNTGDISAANLTLTGNITVDGTVDGQNVAAVSLIATTAYSWGNHASAGYLTSFTETNDLSTAVTWANVPDANITESSVTQHQTALTITESQISDLGSYLTSFTETNDLSAAVTWADVPDTNITQTSVTQHQAALSITESQITDLGSYILTGANIPNTVITGLGTMSTADTSDYVHVNAHGNLGSGTVSAQIYDFFHHGAGDTCQIKSSGTGSDNTIMLFNIGDVSDSSDADDQYIFRVLYDASNNPQNNAFENLWTIGTGGLRGNRSLTLKDDNTNGWQGISCGDITVNAPIGGTGNITATGNISATGLLSGQLASTIVSTASTNTTLSANSKTVNIYTGGVNEFALPNLSDGANIAGRTFTVVNASSESIKIKGLLAADSNTQGLRVKYASAGQLTTLSGTEFTVLSGGSVEIICSVGGQAENTHCEYVMIGSGVID